MGRKREQQINQWVVEVERKLSGKCISDKFFRVIRQRVKESGLPLSGDEIECIGHRTVELGVHAVKRKVFTYSDEELEALLMLHLNKALEEAEQRFYKHPEAFMPEALAERMELMSDRTRGNIPQSVEALDSFLSNVYEHDGDVRSQLVSYCSALLRQRGDAKEPADVTRLLHKVLQKFISEYEEYPKTNEFEVIPTPPPTLLERLEKCADDVMGIKRKHPFPIVRELRAYAMKEPPKWLLN